MTPLLPFLQPGRLWWLLLLGVILVIYLILNLRHAHRRGNKALNIQRILPKQDLWKRHIAVAAAVISLGVLVVAYAQPTGEARVPRDRATIVMVLDVSNSMKAEDVKPNRMEAMQEGAKRFANSIPKSFNLSLVEFAATANLVVPPTTDHRVVLSAIDGLKLRPSTAIGEGIATGLEAVTLAPPDPDDPKKKPPAAIVLLSDGVTNVGRTSASMATEAKQRGIPVYTIAYGTSNATINVDGATLPVPVGYDELREAAKRSGGKYFEADSSDKLKEVYESISSQIGYVTEEKEITGQFVGWAALAALIATLGVISVAARWP